MVGASDYVVDTKNLCFLCYRPAKIVAAGAKGKRVKDKTFSMRCLSRFLGVDFQKLLNRDGTRNISFEGKFPQVLVTVCSRCSKMTEEFATLCQYLEFTQMKLSACARSLRDTMKKTDGNYRLVEQFRKKMTGGVNKSEPATVENARKKMVHRFDDSLKKAFPRVRIRKYGEARLKTKPVAGKPGPRSKKAGFMSTAKPDSPPGTEDKSGGTESDQVFQCIHCDNTFSSTDALQIHIVKFHREQFFLSFKVASVSTEDFKYAVELLFQDVRQITTAKGASESIVSYVCPCCGKPFSSRIDSYVHMVQLHYDVLSTKLQSIQKDPQMISIAKETIKLVVPVSKKALKKPQRGPRGPYKKNVGDGKAANAASPAVKIPVVFPKQCAACGKTLSSRRNWRRHVQKTCKLLPENSTTKPVMKHSPGFPRHCLCGASLGTHTAWKNHLRLYCKLKGKTKGLMSPAGPHGKVAKANKSPRTGKTGKKTYVCPCGTISKNYTSSYSHKRRCNLAKGQEDMDLIEEVPVDITPDGELCIPGLSTTFEVQEMVQPLPAITKVSSPAGVLKGFQMMAGLKKETTTEETVKFEIADHVGKFAKMLRGNGDEVKNHLAKVVEEYRRFPGNISGCPYCGRGFTQVHELQTHMVEGHFEDVLRKLRSFINPGNPLDGEEDGFGSTIDVDPSLVKKESEFMEVDGFATDLNMELTNNIETNGVKAEENALELQNPAQPMGDETNNCEDSFIIGPDLN